MGVRALGWVLCVASAGGVSSPKLSVLLQCAGHSWHLLMSVH
jgi:hypothetical protein